MLNIVQTHEKLHLAKIRKKAITIDYNRRLISAVLSLINRSLDFRLVYF